MAPLPRDILLCKLDESAAGWARSNLRSHWSLLIHGLLCFISPEFPQASPASLVPGNLDYDAFAQHGDKHRLVY